MSPQDRASSSSVEETKKPTLLQLFQDHSRLVAEILELSGDDVSSEKAEALEKAIIALCEKADRYGHVQLQLEQFFESCKNRREEWQRGERAAKHAIESLKNRMRYVLSQLPTQSLSGEEFRYYLTKPSTSFEVVAEELPKNYTRAVISYEPDMEKIRDDFDKGVSIPGVKPVQKQQLRVGRPKL